MSLSVLGWAAAVSCAAWVWLLLFRGNFWRADQRIDPNATYSPPDDQWPVVAVVIPARNEAEGIGHAVTSLLGQDYPGAMNVFVVDDNSDDGTAETARAAAGEHQDRLTIIAGAPLDAGWTGKLWAVSQGIARAQADLPGAEFLLLTDGDIAHGPDNLSQLVTKAKTENLALTSLMVKLRCDTRWERLLIPAFVFFFQKLYPFAWINNPTHKMAGAAGGCMLVRREALEAAGGIERIRDRVIDDCALAEALKPQGPIWLGLTEETHSLRRYDRLDGIWDMVTRTAFVQLDHSLLALCGAVAGMVLLYALPPVVAVGGLWAGNVSLAGAGLGAWALMVLAAGPTLRLYGQSPLRGLLLPVAAVLYTLMTADSARRHYLGRGGAWKGRSYKPPQTLRPDNDR